MQRQTEIIPHSVDKQVLLKGKVINSPSCEITYPMAYKMKYDFNVPVVRQVALDNMSLRKGHSSQNLRTHVHIFSIVKNNQKYPNKMTVYSGGRFWNFLQSIKVASFI